MNRVKRDNDWIDSMRESLHNAEVTPPADGWQRLESELPVEPPRALLLTLKRYLIPTAAVAALFLFGWLSSVWLFDRVDDSVVIDNIAVTNEVDPIEDDHNVITQHPEPRVDSDQDQDRKSVV